MHAWEPEEDEMGKWAARIVCLALAAALSAPFASLAFAQERAASASDEAPAAVGAEGGPAAAGTGGGGGLKAPMRAARIKGASYAWRFPRPKA